MILRANQSRTARLVAREIEEKVRRDFEE